MISAQKQLESLVRSITDLQKQKYYGKVTVTFQQGNIIMLSHSQTVVPESIIKGEQEFVVWQKGDSGEETQSE